MIMYVIVVTWLAETLVLNQALQAPSLKVGDSVYLLNTDGSREGPYLVATAPVSGQCTLCYTNGSPFRNNAGIDVDELEAC